MRTAHENRTCRDFSKGLQNIEALKRSKTMKDLPVTKGTEKGIAVKILPPQDLASRVSEVHAMIARRAYELFANRGCEHGQDLQAWPEAESDIVHVCRHDLRESAEAVVLRAEFPNSFKADLRLVRVE